MEYIEKRWRCDQCSRDVKRGVMPPSGWQEVVIDFYGNTMHVCPNPACVAKTEMFLRENYPSAEFHCPDVA